MRKMPDVPIWPLHIHISPESVVRAADLLRHLFTSSFVVVFETGFYIAQLGLKLIM